MSANEARLPQFLTGKDSAAVCRVDASTMRQAPAADDVDSARASWLRAELADAVAAAELALTRERMEKWRAIAEERERALARADGTINALSHAIAVMSRELEGPPQADNDAPVVAWPPMPTIANVAPEIRDAAIRYTTGPASRPGIAPRRWWQAAK